MNFHGVFFLLGRLLLVLSVALLIPAAVAYFDGEVELVAFLLSAGVAAGRGNFFGTEVRPATGVLVWPE